MRCQVGTSSNENNGYGGRRYYPFVYSESGIAMLSAVLRSDIAVEFGLLTNLIRQASASIVLIDGYVDIVTLDILTKKAEGVDVTLYTLPNTRLTAHDIANFNAQYPKLVVKHTAAFHDRFMIIDGTEGYHIGASLKDAGKKCFAINKIEDVGVINDLIQRAMLTS